MKNGLHCLTENFNKEHMSNQTRQIIIYWLQRGLSKEDIFWECYSKKSPIYVLDDLRKDFDKEYELLREKYSVEVS